MATEPGRLFVFGFPVQGSPPQSAIMQQVLEALACNNYTTNADFPLVATARNGMKRVNAKDPTNVKAEVFLSGSWRTYLQHLENGIPSPSHLEIAVPSSNPWVIDHNLGVRPLVQAYDASWNLLEVVAPAASPGAGQCKVQHVNENRVGVTLSGAAAGFVILIG
jgi:hypothetical protein